MRFMPGSDGLTWPCRPRHAGDIRGEAVNDPRQHPGVA
jgi:hypothetical protein